MSSKQANSGGLLKAKERGGLMGSIIWFSAALFYLYEYLIRVAPSVMMDDLEFAFKVSTGDLSNSLATYYYIYAPAQLAVGVLFDRFGGRRLLVPATLLVALGCLLATFHEQGLWVMTLGRFIMGFGSAFGFVGVMYLASVWYPPHRLALLSGLTTTLGMLGGMMGHTLLAGFIGQVGWENGFLASAGMGVVLAVILLVTIPKAPKWELARRRKYHNAEEKQHSFLVGLKVVLTNSQTWIIGTVGAFLFLAISLFAELWGVSYITHVFEVDKTAAGGACSMVFLGFIVGGPVIGWLSDYWMDRKKPLIIGSIFAALFFAVILLVNIMPMWLMYVMLFGFGFIASAEVVCFIAGIEANPNFLKGTSVASINMIVSFVGGSLQAVAGRLLQYMSHPKVVDGITVSLNSSNDFRMIFLMMPALMLIGAFLCIFIKKQKIKTRLEPTP